MTWRERIRAAADAVDTAYAFRTAEFQRAYDAGLTLRQIAEAAGVSFSTVARSIDTQGHRQRASLDSDAEEGDAT